MQESQRVYNRLVDDREIMSGGAAYGGPCKPDKSVPASLSGLEKQIDELVQGVAAVVQRLSQAGVMVQGPSTQSGQEVLKFAPMPCELAQRVANQTRRLSDVSMNLQEVLASLEL